MAGYVEGGKAEREFGVRQRGGFFEGASGPGDYCEAVLDAACGKLLVLQLVRDVTGAQFVEVRCVFGYFGFWMFFFVAHSSLQPNKKVEGESPKSTIQYQTDGRWRMHAGTE